MNRMLILILKRFFDIIFSLVGLIILTPLFLAISFIIKFTMPGPVFFKQERIGRNAVPFNIIKFRTMKVDPEMERRGLEIKVDAQNDQERMTPTGRVLRRFKLDEIPQLINVLKGNMSLVGPRPTFERQVLKYNGDQKKRLLMKPSMTGLAQVKGGICIPWEERIQYDMKYCDLIVLKHNVGLKKMSITKILAF